MPPAMLGRVAAALPAQKARVALSAALGAVQLLESRAPAHPLPIDELAAASNALYRLENEAETEEAAVSFVLTAIDELTRALSRLHDARRRDPALDEPTQGVARTLAMLYPLSRSHARPRRDVLPPGALSDRDRAQLQSAANRPPMSFRGPERRTDPQPRAVVHVEIGLFSESNFYAGLSYDVSEGGLFVSTHQPAATGSRLTLFFVLPSGRALEIDGVVRWTRAPSDDAPPGMGVAFSRLSPEDLTAISEYCRHRAPLIYEHG
jgi:uncharacterized protein (TIGR02266 family)